MPNVEDVREGLRQHYEREEKTDLSSFNIGRVMAKVGWNKEKTDVDQLPLHSYMSVLIENGVETKILRGRLSG